MDKLILVMVIICPGEKDYYGKELYYSESRCKESGYGTAINLNLATGKKCNYKCVRPEYVPQEVK